MNDIDNIYTPQKKFYTYSQAQYLKIKQNKSKTSRIIKKILKWVLIVYFAALLITGIVTAIAASQNINTTAQLDGTLNAVNPFLVWLLYPLMDIFWLLVWIPGVLCWLMGEVFMKVGGSGIVEAVTNNDQFKMWLGIILGIILSLFVIFLIVRAIRISHKKDSDEGWAMAKSTPGIVFWCIGTMVCMPIIWLTVCTFLMGILLALTKNITGSSQLDVSMTFFKSCCTWNIPDGKGGIICQSIPWPDTWNNFKSCMINPFHPCGHEIMDQLKQTIGLDGPGEVRCQIFLVLILWIVGTILTGLFTWNAISCFFNIIISYVMLFPAVAKWPQDEGGAATMVKNDMVGNWVHLFALYFFFTLSGILISATVVIANQITSGIGAGGVFVSGVVSGLLTLVCIWTCYRYTKKAPEYFTVSRGVMVLGGSDLTSGAKRLSSAGKTAAKPFKAGSEAAKDAKEARGIKKAEFAKAEGQKPYSAMEKTLKSSGVSKADADSLINQARSINEAKAAGWNIDKESAAFSKKWKKVTSSSKKGE